MINIFYNKNGLHDILVLKIDTTDVVTKSVKNQNFIINYNADKIHSISIANISSISNINEGYLFYDNRIKELVKNITNIELDQYEDKNFVIGQVIELDDIPNTHLHLCKVDIGNNQYLQIVCGASNVKLNMKVVVAQVGTIMPNGTTISKGKLQGYDSFGMLCSEKELFNLEKQSSGILEVNSKYNVGDRYIEHYNN